MFLSRTLSIKQHKFTKKRGVSTTEIVHRKPDKLVNMTNEEVTAWANIFNFDKETTKVLESVDGKWLYHNVDYLEKKIFWRDFPVLKNAVQAIKREEHKFVQFRDLGCEDFLDLVSSLKFATDNMINTIKEKKLDGMIISDLTVQEMQDELGFTYSEAKHMVMEMNRRKPETMKALHDELIQKCKNIKISVAPKVFDKEKTKKDLGKFARLDMPYTNNEIDMRFIELPNIPKETAELTEKVSANEPITALLVGTSGCGKTRVMFDLARTNYSIFLECGVPGQLEKNLGSDKLFRIMFQDIEKFTRSHKNNRDSIYDYASDRITLEITSRVIFLRLLANYYIENDIIFGPEEFFVSQLNGGQYCTKQIQKILKQEKFSSYKYSDYLDFALQDIEDILQGTPLIFQIDEANVGYELLKEDKIFKSYNHRKETGLMSLILKILSTLLPGVSLIISGTSISLTIGESVQSDIGKRNVSLIPMYSFDILKKEDVVSRLNQWLNVPPDFEKFASKLTGRARLVSLVPKEIQTQTKSNLVEPNFEDAVDSSIKAVRSDLQEKLTKSFQSDREWDEDEKDTLLFLYLGIKFSTKLKISPNDKLVSLGIMALSASGDLKHSYILESFCQDIFVQCYENIIRKSSPEVILSQALRRAIRYNNNEKGIYFEMLCSIILAKYQDCTIPEFLKKLYPEVHLDNLPEWCLKVKFKLDTYGKFASVGLDAYSDLDVLDYMAKNENSIYLKPIDAARTDMIHIEPLPKGKKIWSCTVSCKLHSNRISGVDIAHDLTSTILAQQYKTKTGEAIDTSNEQRLTDLLKNYELAGEIRLHVTMPGYTNNPKNPFLNSPVVVRDSIILAQIDPKIFVNLDLHPTFARIFKEEYNLD